MSLFQSSLKETKYFFAITMLYSFPFLAYFVLFWDKSFIQPVCYFNTWCAKLSLKDTTIRVELEGEIANKFLELKLYLGLKNNAEVVRNCISICYASIFREGGMQKNDMVARSQVRKKGSIILGLKGGGKNG